MAADGPKKSQAGEWTSSALEQAEETKREYHEQIRKAYAYAMKNDLGAKAAVAKRAENGFPDVQFGALHRALKGNLKWM